LEKKNH